MFSHKPMVFLLVAMTTQTAAFEIDLEKHEVVRLQGRFLIEDLVPPNKGRIGHPCILDGGLFVYPTTPLYETGPFIIQMMPNGNAQMFFDPLDYKGQSRKTLAEHERPPLFLDCEKLESHNLSTPIQVMQVDGYDTYSEWGEFIRKKFPLSE